MEYTYIFDLECSYFYRYIILDAGSNIADNKYVTIKNFALKN